MPGLKKGKFFFAQPRRQKNKEEAQKKGLQENKGKEKPSLDEDLPFLAGKAVDFFPMA